MGTDRTAVLMLTGKVNRIKFTDDRINSIVSKYGLKTQKPSPQEEEDAMVRSHLKSDEILIAKLVQVDEHKCKTMSIIEFQILLDKSRWIVQELGARDCSIQFYLGIDLRPTV